MHHSGLFAGWRMPIATGIAWFHECQGGELAFYPDGSDGPPVTHAVRYNTAILLDTDTVFHGVDRLAETDGPVAALRPGMRLCAEGDGVWRVVDGDHVVARYRWEELRFSISWKAYCFEDEAERCAWHEHSDDLAVESVLERLVDDLRRSGVIRGERPPDHELVDIIIDEYIRFPLPSAQ